MFLYVAALSSLGTTEEKMLVHRKNNTICKAYWPLCVVTGIVLYIENSGVHATSITHQNVQLKCWQLSCIVGNVGAMFGGGRDNL